MAPPRQNRADRCETYNDRTSVRLGALQVTVGILSILTQIIGLVADADNAIYASGLIGGVLFLATGAIGIHAGKKKTRRHIKIFMIMSIISTCLVIPILVCSALGLKADHRQHNWRRIFTATNTISINIELVSFVHCFLWLLAICEAVMAIWSFVICFAEIHSTSTNQFNGFDFANKMAISVPEELNDAPSQNAMMGNQAPGQVGNQVPMPMGNQAPRQMGNQAPMQMVMMQQPAQMNYPQGSGQVFVAAQPGNMPQNVGVPQPINMPAQQVPYNMPQTVGVQQPINMPGQQVPYNTPQTVGVQQPVSIPGQQPTHGFLNQRPSGAAI